MQYKYLGVKFTYTLKNQTKLSGNWFKLLLPWCEFFHQNNLAPPEAGGSAGNMSLRWPGKKGFIITASGAQLAQQMPAQDFVRVIDASFSPPYVTAEGLKAPSSESLLHAAIYHKRREIMAVFHGHSPEILDAAEDLNLPCTKNEQPYGSTALIDEVMDVLGNESFLIIKNHGFLSLGKTTQEAGKRVEKVLLAARKHQ